jgi:hypothetical protein
MTAPPISSIFPHPVAASTYQLIPISTYQPFDFILTLRLLCAFALKLPYAGARMVAMSLPPFFRQERTDAQKSSTVFHSKSGTSAHSLKNLKKR